MRLGTANVKNNFSASARNSQTKAEEFANYVTRVGFDILGTQEVRLGLQRKFTEVIRGYSVVGDQRYSGLMKHTPFSEGTPLIINNRRISIDYVGNEWLSPMIHKVLGLTPTTLPRVVTYSLVSLKENQQQLLHINTHLHYMKDKLQLRQLQLLVDLIKRLNEQYPNIPTILTGDLNISPNDDRFKGCSEK